MRRERTDRLLRFLGADPRVFRPFYRVQKLLLRRSTRVAAVRGRKTGSQGLLCLLAVGFALPCAALEIKSAAQPGLGGGLALTLGSLYLLVVILLNHAEALVLPGEWLVLAAHPHDDRSLVLAKLAAVGRLMAQLAAFLFTPICLAGAFLWGPAAALALVAGAASLTVAVTVFGLLLALALVRAGGRRAMERVMPWLQVGVQASFLLPGATSLVEPARIPAAARALLAWLLPPFWFAAPLEVATGVGGAGAWARLALAGGGTAAMLAAVAGLAAGTGARLLEPEPRATRAAHGAVARASAARAAHGAAARASAGGTRQARGRPWSGQREAPRLMSLLRVHLRSDWRSRSDLFSLPVTGMFFLVVNSLQSRPSGAVMLPFFYLWFLFVSADSLTRSQRPENLWWVLASPIDRTRFSMASVWLLRLLVLAPMTAVLATLVLLHGGPDAAARSWAWQLWLLAALVTLGDLLLLAGKLVFPEFPFSRGRAGGAAGSRFALAMLGVPVTGAVLGALTLGKRFGVPGLVATTLAGVVLHLPVGAWARRRAARAAAQIDLAGIG